MFSTEEVLTHVYTALRYERDREEGCLSDQLADWLPEIEDELGHDAADLAYERFIKTGDDHLYKGAKVRAKRNLYYGELFNDLEGQEPNAIPWIFKGTEGEIVATWLDTDESDDGYFDCSVLFENPYLCRVEWLEWIDDDIN